MIKFNKAKSPIVQLWAIQNNNNFKKWTALHLVFELTHLVENKEPLNGCYHLNGQPLDCLQSAFSLKIRLVLDLI